MNTEAIWLCKRPEGRQENSESDAKVLKGCGKVAWTSVGDSKNNKEDLVRLYVLLQFLL